jgi:aryl-alcohol dehydrogenase-like predicted oxidoreductase
MRGAVNVEQLRDNLKVLDLTLTSDGMTAISALACGMRIINPPQRPVWD